MARLVVKSPYIKSGGAGRYLRYIATRERVQIVADDRPPTHRLRIHLHRLGGEQIGSR